MASYNIDATAANAKSEMTIAGDVVVDNSSGELVDGVIIDNGLQRSLKQRHIQMIALGGVVGYGLPLQSN